MLFRSKSLREAPHNSGHAATLLVHSSNVGGEFAEETEPFIGKLSIPFLVLNSF